MVSSSAIPPTCISKRGKTGMIRPKPIESMKIVTRTKGTTWRWDLMEI
jgi:hypothetical protein